MLFKTLQTKRIMSICASGWGFTVSYLLAYDSLHMIIPFINIVKTKVTGCQYTFPLCFSNMYILIVISICYFLFLFFKEKKLCFYLICVCLLFFRWLHQSATDRSCGQRLHQCQPHHCKYSKTLKTSPVQGLQEEWIENEITQLSC